MRKTSDLKSGFSLMEMMVVLLITAIVAAACAPIINKKMVKSAAANSTPWQWSGMSGSIVYNFADKDRTAFIGPVEEEEAANSKLFISSNDDNPVPHIGFKHGANRLFFRFANNGISLTDSSDAQIDPYSVAIGVGARISPDSTFSTAIGAAMCDASNTIAIGNGAFAKYFGLAVGHEARATGDTSIAIGVRANNPELEEGEEPVTAGKNSIAIGNRVQASGQEAVAVGTAALASQQDSIAIGNSAKADNQSAIAIGIRANNPELEEDEDPVTAGKDSIAIGSSAIANADRSVAVGNSATASNTDAIAIGVTSLGSEQDSIAIGNSAIANNQSAIAIGIRANNPELEEDEDPVTAGQDSIAVGNSATASAQDTIAIGNGARANTRNSIVIGGQNNNKRGMILIGHDQRVPGVFYDGYCDANIISIGVRGDGLNSSTNKIMSHDVLAIGSNYVDGYANYSTAIGVDSIVYKRSTSSVAIGNNAQTNHEQCIAIGHNAQAGQYANGGNSIAIGNAKAYKKKNIMIGDDLLTNNNNSIAIGAEGDKDKRHMVGEYSMTIGSRAVADGDHAIAIGSWSEEDDGAGSYGAIAQGSHSIAIGVANYAPGRNNIALGTNAHALNGDNVISIGHDVWAGPGNILSLGIASYTVRIPGTLETNTSSDRRLKNIGEVFKGGLAELKKLEFFHYTFKKDEEKIPHVGVIAQDLIKVFPDAVFKGEDGFYRIRMEDMFYAVINAVKELDERLTAVVEPIKSVIEKTNKLEAQAKSQQEVIDMLQKQNVELRKRLAMLE